MLTTLLLIIIVLGLLVIFFILGRHLPQVAQLNLESLPLEQEHQKKKEIISKRLAQEGKVLEERTKSLLRPLVKWWGTLQASFRRYVHRVEKLWRHEKTLAKSDLPDVSADEVLKKINSHLKQGNEELERKMYEAAETAFIAAIKIDPKCAKAYKGLAETYVGRELWEEAKQTYLFLVKLTPEDDSAFAAFGEVEYNLGNVEAAIQKYEQAVVLNDALSPRFYRLAELLLSVNQPAVAREAILSALALEPKNPKYLDLAVETAILMSDKESAEREFHELRLVNPDNQKLPILKDRIEKL